MGTKIQVLANQPDLPICLACQRNYAQEVRKQEGGRADQCENDHLPSKLDWYANHVPRKHGVSVVVAAVISVDDFSSAEVDCDGGRRGSVKHSSRELLNPIPLDQQLVSAAADVVVVVVPFVGEGQSSRTENAAVAVEQPRIVPLASFATLSMLLPYPYYVDDNVTMLVAVGNISPGSDSSHVDNCSPRDNNRQLVLFALVPIVHGVCHVHVQQIVEDCIRRRRPPDQEEGLEVVVKAGSSTN